jgi:hypothetical protein
MILMEKENYDLETYIEYLADNTSRKYYNLVSPEYIRQELHLALLEEDKKLTELDCFEDCEAFSCRKWAIEKALDRMRKRILRDQKRTVYMDFESWTGDTDGIPEAITAVEITKDYVSLCEMIYRAAFEDEVIKKEDYGLVMRYFHKDRAREMGWNTTNEKLARQFKVDVPRRVAKIIKKLKKYYDF